MKALYYVWVNEETGETRTTKSWPEVQAWVKNEGGSYTKEEEKLPELYSEYCKPNAAGARRFKNYKF